MQTRMQGIVSIRDNCYQSDNCNRLSMFLEALEMVHQDFDLKLSHEDSWRKV